ncbi:MAG: DUF4252 domain-containing protein [Bacteroidetes bacterium]|nr:DUF4252 domain-containing protein [Bacteroidota bacterium]MBT7095018.1 DUF4252 domain-containing protein [Bacteroidota bacterium]MBT7464671.1 DUF4252 domain-containing protein [Bacteroidota bacterium]
MKKLILLLAIIGIAATGWSQNKVVDDLVEKYSGVEGFTSVVITKYMFGLFSNVETEEDDDYMNMIKNLNNIKILSAPGSAESGINFFKEALDKLPSKEYEELMIIKDAKQDIKFLVKEEKGKVVELLMLIGGEEDNVLISITGVIDMNTIAKLSKSMNIEGMENLEKIEKKWPK